MRNRANSPIMADEGDSLSIESCSAQAEEEERSQRVDSTNSNHGWTRKAKKGKEALKAEEAPPKNALSWTVIGILSLTMFGNSLTMTSLFPFVGYMVQAFHVTENLDQVGYYVGLIASSLFLGRFIGSYLWGGVADKRGRRPVMIVSMLCVSASTFAFGFSVNLPMAIVTRLLTGVLNGSVGTAKTILSEVTDNTNQAKGMSIMGASWGFGLIVGPALGGLLYDPGVKYPSLFGPFFVRFPVFLPSLLVASVCLLAGLLSMLFLPETLRHNQPNMAEQLEEEEDDGNDEGEEERKREGMSSDELEMAVLESDGTTKVEENTPQRLARDGSSKRRRRSGKGGLCSPCLRWYRRSTLYLLLRDRSVVVSLFLYSVFGLANMGFEEVYSLFCLTSPDAGGLGFTSTEIGLSLTAVGLIVLYVSLVIYPILERRFGARNVGLCSATIMTVAIVLFPTISFLHNRVAIWTTLILLGALLRTVVSIIFTSVSLFINNSVPRSRAGSMNGLAMSMTAIARTFGPTLFGSTWAWSINSGLPYPFDKFFTFYVLGVFIVSCVVVMAMLPPSIDLQYDTRHQATALVDAEQEDAIAAE